MGFAGLCIFCWWVEAAFASTSGGQVLQCTLETWRGGVVRLKSLFDDRGLHEGPEGLHQPINIS